MDTFLCKNCGARMDNTMRQCPDCGAINYANVEVLKTVVENKQKEQKAVKRFSFGFVFVGLLFGIVFLCINIAVFLSGAETYLLFDFVISSIASIFLIAFSGVGLIKSERNYVPKGIFISFLVAAGSLALGAWLLLV